MYVCLCNAISDTQIQEAINEGACSLDCLRSSLGLASQCGKCAVYAEAMLTNATLAGRSVGVSVKIGEVGK